MRFCFGKGTGTAWVKTFLRDVWGNECAYGSFSLLLCLFQPVWVPVSNHDDTPVFQSVLESRGAIEALGSYRDVPAELIGQQWDIVHQRVCDEMEGEPW